jgi:hypothetical protein
MLDLGVMSIYRQFIVDHIMRQCAKAYFQSYENNEWAEQSTAKN